VAGLGEEQVQEVIVVQDGVAGYLPDLGGLRRHA